MAAVSSGSSEHLADGFPPTGKSADSHRRRRRKDPSIHSSLMPALPLPPLLKTSNTKTTQKLLSLISECRQHRRVCERSISRSPATKNNSRCRFNAHMSCTENRSTRWLRYCGRCLNKCLRLSVQLFISWSNTDTQIFAKGHRDPLLF